MVQATKTCKYLKIGKAKFIARVRDNTYKESSNAGPEIVPCAAVIEGTYPFVASSEIPTGMTKCAKAGAAVGRGEPSGPTTPNRFPCRCAEATTD